MTHDGPLTVLAFLEADTVTGPATTLLQFHRVAPLAAAAGKRRVRMVVALFTRGSAAAPKTVMRDTAEVAGLPIVLVRERFRFDPRAVATIRRVVREVGPDLVETHSLKSHLLMRISGVAGAVPWVAFHHGYTHTDAKVALYNHSDRVSLRRASRVVTPAHAFVSALVGHGVARNRVVVLPNAIDPVREAPSAADKAQVRAGWRVKATDVAMLCVARLSREKGHRDLVAALARLHARDPHTPLRLILAGDGPERAALQSMAERGGVAGAIRWLGHVEGAQRLYAGADAAVLPSYSEGSPIALLEAAAHGLPIVATHVGGVPEMLVDGESALLVPPHDEHALAAALQRIVTDRALGARLGRNARGAIEVQHDPVARTSALIQLYEQVTGAAPASPEYGVRACAY